MLGAAATFSTPLASPAYAGRDFRGVGFRRRGRQTWIRFWSARDSGFVEVRELVLLRLRSESKFVDMVDDLTQVVAALNAVLDLAEDLADLVLNSVRTSGFGFEALQVGKQFLIDEY